MSVLKNMSIGVDFSQAIRWPKVRTVTLVDVKIGEADYMSSSLILDEGSWQCFISCSGETHSLCCFAFKHLHPHWVGGPLKCLCITRESSF